MKKKRRKAKSGSTAIHFNEEERARIDWAQADLGLPTLAAAVKWAIKDACDRRRDVKAGGARE